MHSNTSEVSLFLFAHQDDEFGVFHQIELEIKSRRRIVCVYVTDGSATASTKTRDLESSAILKKLGVNPDNIISVGSELNIRDGSFYRNTDTFAIWLESFIEKNPGVASCFVPAWEGGHPDHDMLHALTIYAFHTKNLLSIIRQYSLYNAKGCFGPFFRILTPLLENGQISHSYIPWRSRIRYLKYCLSYKSQWRSWLGLFPAIFFYYIFTGKQQLQPVSLSRVTRRPHEGRLYYEARGGDWSAVQNAIKTSLHFKP